MILNPKSKKSLLEILNKITDLKILLGDRGIVEANELITALKRIVVASFVNEDINELMEA